MGNKLVLIVVAVIVVIGAVIGLGVAGIVPIPGLTKPKHEKAKKADPDADAKKVADAKADEDKAKKESADALQKLVANRDELIKSGKWQAALGPAQQAVDMLTQNKPGSPELTSATQVLSHVKDESDKAKLPKPDLDKGYEKLAAVWGEMPPDKIQALLEAQNKPELAAPILKRMDEDKVAAVLAGMLPEKAAEYSAAIAKEASKPPAPAAPAG